VRGRPCATRTRSLNTRRRRLKFARIATAEGNTYLGFLFAYAETASQVEECLRQAHQFLDFEIMETLRVVSR
jgi:hypothetical protein